MLRVLGGGAPVGFEYQDVEEEFVVDPKTRIGAWQQVKPAAPAAAAGDGAGPSGTATAGAGAAAAGTPAAGGGTEEKPDIDKIGLLNALKKKYSLSPTKDGLKLPGYLGREEFKHLADNMRLCGYHYDSEEKEFKMEVPAHV